MVKEIKEKFTFQLSSLEPFLFYHARRLKPLQRFFPKTLNEIIYLFLIYLTLSFFFFSKNFFNYYIAGDFTSYWLPHYPFLLNSLRDGYLPFWNPYSVLGIPELFKLEMGYFYPPILFTLILNYFFNPSNSLTIIGKSFEVLNYFHLFIGMLGTFLFIRQILKLKFIPALLGGICYSFTPFGIWGLTSLTPNMGNMLFPLLMYSTQIYLDDFTNIKKYIFLIFLNVCIFTLGDPYLYFYFFLAQILLATICFGFKGFVRFGVNYWNSLLLAAPLLFLSFHMLTQSNRSEGIANSFSQQWSFLPTRILNIFNPFFYNDMFSQLDPKGLFTWSVFCFGSLPVFLFISGILNFKNKRKYFFLLFLLIGGFLYCLNFYSGLPELLSTIFPFINSFRSHTKILALIIFSFSCIASIGTQSILEKNLIDNRLNRLVALFVLLFFIVILLIQSVHSETLQINSEILLNSMREIIFLSFYILLLNLFIKTKNNIALILVFFIFILELFNFSVKFEIFKLDTSYSNYYSRYSLIYDSNHYGNEIFRYGFDGNQYAYSTIPIQVFNQGVYESAAYRQYYSISRLGTFKQLQFSNTKYIISTNPAWEKTNDAVVLKKAINPVEKSNETYISNVPGLPYWTAKSQNIHYVYEIKNYLPRFYVPKQVVRCDDGGGCLRQENPPEIVVASGLEKEFINPSRDTVKIGLTSYTPNNVELKISSPQNTFIASSEILDKGWVLRINGTKSDFYNVSDGFRGFIAPSGDSIITMNYFPPFLREGSILSFFGLLILLFLYKSKFYIVK